MLLESNNIRIPDDVKQWLNENIQKMAKLLVDFQSLTAEQREKHKIFPYYYPKLLRIDNPYLKKTLDISIMYSTFDKLERVFGKRIKSSSNAPAIYFPSKRTIFINVDNALKEDLYHTLLHEITHAIDPKLDPENTELFKKSMRQYKMKPHVHQVPLEFDAICQEIIHQIMNVTSDGTIRMFLRGEFDSLPHFGPEWLYREYQNTYLNRWTPELRKLFKKRLYSALVDKGMEYGVYHQRHLAEAKKPKKVISFDYDGTLANLALLYDKETKQFKEAKFAGPNKKVVDILKKYAANDFDIVITVSRVPDKQGGLKINGFPTPEEFVQALRLPVKNIIYTSGTAKVIYLLQNKVVRHYDDDEREIDAIQKFNEEGYKRKISYVHIKNGFKKLFV